MPEPLFRILKPTRQSDIEVMSCPKGYVEIVEKGRRLPASIPSERGIEIHEVMAAYYAHCAALRVRSDWNYFDKLSAKVGYDDAGPILDGLRDSYEIDWEHFYAAEMVLALDADWNPTKYVFVDGELRRIDDDDIPGLVYSEKPAEHIGTLDVILLSDDGTAAIIPDYKSHPAIFEADTYQGLAYPAMLFKHFPKLQTVTFRLTFVRYVNCFREVTWKRSELPEMLAAMERARLRQLYIKQHPEEAKALPSKVCTYCPLAMDFTCPVAEFNERMTLSPEDRVRWKEWMRRMSEMNNKILKDYAEVRGPVTYTDGNGKEYVYGEQEVEETTLPLDESLITILRDYKEASGEDFLNGRLNVSQSKLKSLLKADKKKPARRALREQLEDSCYMKGTKPKYAVRTPDEGIAKDEVPWEEIYA